jgi:uncharacterized RDD family membrane protein YckC
MNLAPRYGGFWLRALAMVVDLLLLALVLWLLRMVVGVVYEEVLSRTVLDAEGETFAQYRAVHTLVRDLLGIGLPFVYFTLMEGLGGATVGKRMAGIRVRGPGGRSIGLLRAALRNVVKPLSFACCCGGILLAAWTARKRALHDWIAGTVVVKAQSQ